MNYRIIRDEEKLKEFIEWLPELRAHEKYCLCLFARNKYCKQLVHIKSDKAQLKRFVSDKKRMFYKIQQLEIALGAYKQKDAEVPEEALALYITPNPRNMFKATVNTMVKLAQSIRDKNVEMNPHQEALSEIQKAKSRTCYIDFDIDADEEGLMGSVEFTKKNVNPEAITWIRTRGGAHCLIDPSKAEHQYKNAFYQKLKGNPYVDQAGDNMIPVVGCTQGNFTPHFINF